MWFNLKSNRLIGVKKTKTITNDTCTHLINIDGTSIHKINGDPRKILSEHNACPIYLISIIIIIIILKKY
jgi:hypothetical protein